MENENVEGENLTPRLEAKSPLQLAFEAFAMANPSQDVQPWAKKSCNNCLGRGIEGQKIVKDPQDNVFKFDSVCYCVRKRYGVFKKKWVDSWLKENPDGLNKVPETIDNLTETIVK